jgi:hypothetical protein
LISYEIRQRDPFLSVAECAPGTGKNLKIILSFKAKSLIGDYCGSTFIDRNFIKLFADRMGRHLENLSPTNIQQVHKNFESAKIAFRGVEKQRSYFVNVPTVGDIEEAGVIGGNFEITAYVILSPPLNTTNSRMTVL